jgi:transposase
LQDIEADERDYRRPKRGSGSFGRETDNTLLPHAEAWNFAYQREVTCRGIWPDKYREVGFSPAIQRSRLARLSGAICQPGGITSGFPVIRPQSRIGPWQISGKHNSASSASCTGILFVLRGGLPWQMLPREMGCGSGSTCWRRLVAWQRAGVWQRLRAARRASAIVVAVSGGGAQAEPRARHPVAVGPCPTVPSRLALYKRAVTGFETRS